MHLRLGPLRVGVMVFDRTLLEALVEKLSGWQRKQWVRAGSPMDEASLRRFAQLQRGQGQTSHGRGVQGELCMRSVSKGKWRQ